MESKAVTLLNSAIEQAVDAINKGGQVEEVLDTYGIILAKGTKKGTESCRGKLKAVLVILGKIPGPPPGSNPKENRSMLSV